MSDLLITTADSNADDSLVEIDAGTINQFVTPSTARKENEEGHIVSQGNDVEDAWPGNESTNKQTGGTQEGNRLAHW